jgi:hypothetical protein
LAGRRNGFTNMYTGVTVRMPAPPPPACAGSANQPPVGVNVAVFVLPTTPKSRTFPPTLMFPELTGGLLPEFVLLGPGGVLDSRDGDPASRTAAVETISTPPAR